MTFFTPHNRSMVELWVAAPNPSHRVSIGNLVVVSRLLFTDTEPLPVLPATIPLGEVGALVVTQPFEPEAGTGAAWRARGHLRGRRLARSTRVEIAVSAWADAASELVVRPVSRSPHLWGQRRLRRYRRLAPMAADELVRRLRPAPLAIQPVPCAPDEPCAELRVAA